MAGLTGDFKVSLRVTLIGEECARCHVASVMFIEPAGICAACWSIFVLNGAVDCLKMPNPE
jgi:hypothetical protein